MEVSKVAIFNTKIPKTKKRKFAEGVVILGGSTALGAGTCGIIDYFTERKSYKRIFNRETAIYNKNVEEKFTYDIADIKKQGIQVTEDLKQLVHDFYEKTERPKYDATIDLLNKLRKSRLKKHFGIAVGIGAGVGAIAVIVKSAFEKKYASQTSQTTVKEVSPTQHFAGNKIAFTSLLDKVSEQLSNKDRELILKYIKGENASPEELAAARRIANYRIDRDWPKGLNEHNMYMYGVNGSYAVYSKPKTDKEYQMIILKQEIVVPEEPPKYYRNYDKWFNTERWQKFQTWEEYTQKSLQFERMETLVNKARLSIYAEEKAAIELAAKKELCAAYIKNQINQDFLQNFNSNNKGIKIPNSIMILGKNKKETAETIKWIVAKANSNYIFIEDKGESNELKRDQILTMLEEAQTNYAKNGKRTLIWIENFDKLLSNKAENEDVVADFKDLLDKLSDTYKTTIVFDCSNTQKLNPIAIQPHRVKKYNIDREISPEEFQKLQDNFVLSTIKKIKDSDGYRFNYVPFNDESYVDLYLSDFGHTSDILWVDSQNAEAIKAVIKNFDTIKKIPKFKDIKSLKFPKPNDLKDFDDNKLMCSGNITKDGKVIYEYFV